jgi:hypothetical protein
MIAAAAAKAHRALVTAAGDHASRPALAPSGSIRWCCRRELI